MTKSWRRRKKASKTERNNEAIASYTSSYFQNTSLAFRV